MKFRTTQKAIKENYSDIIEVRYADLSDLLTYKAPIAYTCGVYGWNADVYDIDRVAIVTGYRPFENFKPAYEVIRQYNEKAKKIRELNISLEELKKRLDDLITEFIKEVTK